MTNASEVSEEACAGDINGVCIPPRARVLEISPEFLGPQFVSIWNDQFAPHDADAGNEHCPVSRSEVELVGPQSMTCDALAEGYDERTGNLISRDGQVVDPHAVRQLVFGAQVRNRVEHPAVDKGHQYRGQRGPEASPVVRCSDMSDKTGDVSGHTELVDQRPPDHRPGGRRVELLDVESQILDGVEVSGGIVALRTALSRAHQIARLDDLVQMELQPLMNRAKSTIRVDERPCLAAGGDGSSDEELFLEARCSQLLKVVAGLADQQCNISLRWFLRERRAFKLVALM